MKKSFIIGVKEVHIQPYKVRADSKEKAIEIIRKGGGEIIESDFVYSHTLSSDCWTINETP